MDGAPTLRWDRVASKVQLAQSPRLGGRLAIGRGYEPDENGLAGQESIPQGRKAMFIFAAFYGKAKAVPSSHCLET